MKILDWTCFQKFLVCQLAINNVKTANAKFVKEKDFDTCTCIILAKNLRLKKTTAVSLVQFKKTTEFTIYKYSCHNTYKLLKSI